MTVRIRFSLPIALPKPLLGAVPIAWAALGTARWVIEGLGIPMRLAWLAGVILGMFAVSIGGAWLVRRYALPLRPFWIAGVYLVWPIVQPTVGVLFTGLGLLTLLIEIRHALLRGWWPEGLVFLGGIAVYLHTLAPTVLPADAGEFQLVIPLLGIAHPPGYALYTLLGRLFTLLPLREMAYRVNVYGAVCGAAALALVMRCTYRVSGSRWGGLLAALALGTTPTFWAQSTTANIRSLMALLTALSLWLLIEYLDAGRERWLTLFAFTFGLSVGHHGSLAFLGIPFVGAILGREPSLIRSPRRWVKPVAAFAASFLVLLYLPVRSAMQPAFDPTPIRTAADFLNHVLARGFRGDMFYFRTPEELTARASIWANIMALEFGPWLSLAMPLAALALLGSRRHRLGLAALGGAAVINIFLALTYRAPQTVEYLIPSYVALAILLGSGAGLWAEKARLRGQGVLGSGILALLITLALFQGATTYPSMRALSQDRSERTYAETLLRNAPAGALILANWHHATALWYLQYVEGLRPDVTVQYVYPQGAKPNETVWLEAVSEAIASRPVIVTNRYYAYDQTDYRWIPFHGAWLVHRGPLWEVPPDLIPREALCGEVIRILGYQLDDTTLTPGENVSLRIYWTPLKPLEADYSSFVQLLGPGGVMGQGDIPQPTRTYLPSEVRVDAYEFPLLLQAAPGTYRLITGFYTVEDGRWSRLPTAEGDVVTLQDLTLQPAAAPPPSLHPQHASWANGLRLTGMDADRSVAGQVRLYLHWRCPKRPFAARECMGASVNAVQDGNTLAQGTVPSLHPGQAATIVLDLPKGVQEITLALTTPGGQAVPALGFWGRMANPPTLRVPKDERYLPLGGQMALTAATYRTQGTAFRAEARFLALRPLTVDTTISVGLRGEGWEIKDDGTPALGAIPTLKWLAGWRVRDPHTLPLAHTPKGAEAWLTLGAYDAFTLRPLHVLDERLAREGQGTELLLTRVHLGQ